MTLLITIIVLAIIFDFINGFHDAANSIATVVSTRVLSPFQAVLWAAAFNFVAFFIAKYIIQGFGIASTVSKTVILDQVGNPSTIIIAALTAAIIWNLLTWRLGIPSSSSHTLIGGLAGAAIAGGGFEAVHAATVLKIASFIILAPLIGMVAGNIITIITYHLAKGAKPSKAERWFKGLQLVSSALLSIGHGLNDSQKVMGVIAVALATNQALDLPAWMEVSEAAIAAHGGDIATAAMNEHIWIALACFSAIAFGTMGGGWKIMKTMGNKITKITPTEGFTSQTASAITLFIAEIFAIPVSTTHVISGSIMGVGAVKRLSAVRWGVTINLLWAWILTIPVSAVLAAVTYYIISMIGIQ